VINADRIVVLEHGKVAEIGSHQELLAKQGLYYQMFTALSLAESELAPRPEARTQLAGSG
jgi:ABC-type transport system involved in cytochrome bd biosynthesis fused ATPase/permease subunit